MHTRRSAICMLLLASALAFAGCQSGQPTDESAAAAAAPAAAEPASAEPAPAVAPESPAVADTDAADADAGSEPVPIALGEYDRVWAAAVDVLRDWQFVVNRRDRRFGIITTEPQSASTVIEPWRPDHAATGRLAESTINHQRRTVRITLIPVDDAAVAVAADPNADPAATPYRMAVVASVDRRHHPPRQLTTAAVGRIDVATAQDRFKPIYTERGREESFWEPVGRDAEFERHLAAAILRRASERFAESATPAPPN